MILSSFERNTIRAFLDVSGREKLGFPWHGRQPVRPQLMLETFGLPDRADLPHVLLSARESWIDEGMGARCSAARPFDSDLPTVVLEILSRGKMADLIPEDREKLFERQNEFFIVGLGMSVPFLQNQYAFVFPSLSAPGPILNQLPSIPKLQYYQQDGRSTWLCTEARRAGLLHDLDDSTGDRLR